MSHLDVDALRKAIDQRNATVLRWYVEHATEQGSGIIGPEDAEARMLYFQMSLQHRTDSGRGGDRLNGPTVSTVMQQSAPHVHHATQRRGLGNALSTPSLRQVAFTTPPSSRTSSQALHESTTQFAPSVASGSTSGLAPHTTAPREYHPVKVHHGSSRRLFRSYGAYIASGDAEQPTKPHENGSRASWSSEWNASVHDNGRLGAAPPGAGVASPTADTSTFLLHRVGSVTASPRTLTLTRKNFDLHEDEERIDIMQLETYEWQQLLFLAHGHYTRVLGHVHRQEAIRAETAEGTARLDISSRQVDVWANLIHQFNEWRNGPAKAQNAMLVNEIVLRARITSEEAHARREMDTVQRNAAEHQLSDLRRMRWLEQEHRRAAEMHQVIVAALAHQGVVGSMQEETTALPKDDFDLRSKSPSRYPTLLPQVPPHLRSSHHHLAATTPRGRAQLQVNGNPQACRVQ